MEIVGSDRVTVSVNNGGESGLSLSAEGNISICEIELPASSNAFVSFICTNPCQWDFALASFHLGMKALSVATETYIRINSDGMMCIQHLLETDMGEDTTIDFILVSSEDVEGSTQLHPHQSSFGLGDSSTYVDSDFKSGGFSRPHSKLVSDDEDDAGYDDYTR